MMSEPLPSGWHSAPSEARRWIRGPSSPPTSFPLPVFLVPSPRSPFHLSLSLSFSLFFPLFTSLYLVSFASAPPSGERPRCSPVLRTATRANITTGSSRGHGVTVDGSLGAVSPIPWNYHGATMGVHPAGSASSAGYVLHANDHRSAGLSSFVRSYRFCLSLSLHDSINVVNVSILAFHSRVSVLESWSRRSNCEVHSGLKSVRRLIILILTILIEKEG